LAAEGKASAADIAAIPTGEDPSDATGGKVDPVALQQVQKEDEDEKARAHAEMTGGMVPPPPMYAEEDTAGGYAGVGADETETGGLRMQGGGPTGMETRPPRLPARPARASDVVD